MAEVVLRVYIDVVVWVAVLGLVVFLFIYIRTEPWQTPMGRHILVFMASLVGAFGYALVSPYLDMLPRLVGWAVSLSVVSIAIWWRTAMIMNYRRKARKDVSNAP
jgi:hypothetical protein